MTSDRTSYQNGETAHFTATFENISGRPCSYAGTTVTSQIIAPTGLPLTAPQVLARENVDNVPFQPGATQTFRSSWEVATCSTPSMCFPGRYTMVIDVVPFGGGRVPVAVT